MTKKVKMVKKIQTLSLISEKKWRLVIDRYSQEPYTFANAQKAFVMAYGSILKGCTDSKAWRIWNGGYWEEIGKSVLHQLIQELYIRVYIPNATQMDQVYRWLIGMVELTAKEEEFDRPLLKVNCLNTTWSPEGCYKPQSSDMLTQQLAVAYKPERLKDLHKSKWFKFLHDTCTTSGGRFDVELYRYLQKTVGYTLYTRNTHQVIFFIHGVPDTGKTTFVEAIRGVFGPYAHTMDPRTLLANRRQDERDGSKPAPDVAALRGKRLVVSSEVMKKGRLNSAFVKELTSNAPITTRTLYRDLFTFTPQMEFWLTMNDLPSFNHTDEGIRKRVKVVPFQHIVGGTGHPPIDRGLRELFCADQFEQEVILAWVIRGLENYLKDKVLQEPECVVKASNAYGESQCPLEAWFLDCCEKSNSSFTSNRKIEHSIKYWAEKSGSQYEIHFLLNTRERTAWMEKHGYTKAKKHQERGYYGFKVNG